MNLKEHQAKIQKLPYKCFSLRSAEGKRLISANTDTQPSKLPAIIAALEDMPPGSYVIRCSNNSKDGYDYPIVTQPTNAPATNVSTSQASADDLKTAERLGRLESENAFLRQQLAEAGERIQALFSFAAGSGGFFPPFSAYGEAGNSAMGKARAHHFQCNYVLISEESPKNLR
jgi:hypothetical protein